MTAVPEPGVRTHPLPISGLLLTAVDPEADVWALERPDSRHRLRYVAVSALGILGAGYIIRGWERDAALAFGRALDSGSPFAVRFTTARLRWRSESTVAPQLVSAHLWVAEAIGAFDLAVVEVGGEPLASARLAFLSRPQ